MSEEDDYEAQVRASMARVMALGEQQLAHNAAVAAGLDGDEEEEEADAQVYVWFFFHLHTHTEAPRVNHSGLVRCRGSRRVPICV